MVLAGMAPRRRWLLIGVLAAVLVVAAVVLVRVWRPAAATGYPDQRDPGPVLLVPGYGGNTGSLAPLAARIRATGRTAVVVRLPDGGTGDLVAQAAAVQAAVSRLDADSVDLVGYSAGGVVVRLWVDRYQGAHRARRVVTLGAPLHGTRLAAVGSTVAPDVCPTACQQLQPGSPLLARLDATPLPAELRWLSVWTRDDQTVTPPTSARLAGAVNVAVQSICRHTRVAHGELPSDPLVTGLVLRAIGRAPLTAPDPGSCAALRGG